MGSSLAAYAKQFVGTPYVWGGNDLRKGIDCSGLVQQVYKRYGINLPRVTYDQIGQGKSVKMEGLRAGDLVFFDTIRGRSGPDHVGIYLGKGQMIHAPRPGKPVEVVDMSKGYYADLFMGGRRIEGVKVPDADEADFVPEGAPGADPKLDMEDLASRYGYAYSFLKSDAELESLFAQAVSGSWSPEKFAAAVKGGNWFRTTSESRRLAQAMKASDSATWDAKVEATTAAVRGLAATVGAALSERALKSFAEDALETGMDEGMMRNALSKYVDFTKNGTLMGEAGQHESNIRAFAFDHGIEISDQAIKQQAQRVIAGLATQQDFETEIRSAAKSMFPALSQQIDAGQSVKQLAGPYMQMMAAELDLPDNQIGLNDPLIKRALNGLDQSGKPAGLTLTDFQVQLRNDPRWGQTRGAMNATMDMARGVLKDFGVM